jgi:hypothetical protein
MADNDIYSPPKTPMGNTSGGGGGSGGGGTGTTSGGANDPKAKPTNTDELLEQSVASSATSFFRIFGINASGIGSTSALTQATPPAQFMASKPINQGASAFNLRGGVLADLFSQIAQRQNLTQGLTAPPVQGVPVMAASMQNMAWSSLGTLTPSAGGGTEQSRGISGVA